MTKTLTAAAMILLLAPSIALAQHRAGDAALGALSGAVVLGPIGATAPAGLEGTRARRASGSYRWNQAGRRSRRKRRACGDDQERSQQRGADREIIGAACGDNRTAGANPRVSSTLAGVGRRSGGLRRVP